MYKKPVDTGSYITVINLYCSILKDEMEPQDTWKKLKSILAGYIPPSSNYQHNQTLKLIVH